MVGNQILGNSLGNAGMQQRYDRALDPASTPRRPTQIDIGLEAVLTQVEHLEEQTIMLFGRLVLVTGEFGNMPQASTSSGEVRAQLVPLAERLAGIQYRLSQVNASMETVISRLEI